MKTIEFETDLSGGNGLIKLPDEYKQLSGHVKVILLTEEAITNQKGRLLALMQKAKSMQLFRNINNPVEWQKNTRNEWE